MLAALFAAYLLAASPLAAQTIVDEWSEAKLPAPPQLKPAKVDAKEAALLVMDFTTQTCSSQRRPRCAASVPKIAKLVADARAKGALVIYSIAGAGRDTGQHRAGAWACAGRNHPARARAGQIHRQRPGAELKAKGIKTLIAVGTQAQTSVLHTAGAAALRGFTVVVPVDGMSSDDSFPELYTAWHLSTAARIADKVTLTKIDMVSF